MNDRLRTLLMIVAFDARIAPGTFRKGWSTAPISIPYANSKPMKALLQFSERFGSMLSRALLTILYFLLLGPFALLYQLFADPLHLKKRPQGNWSTWDSTNNTLADARRQD